VIVLGIDPGPVQSGFAWFRDGVVSEAGVLLNGGLLCLVESEPQDSGAVLAIETMQASYSATIGASVIDTLRWVGRYQQAWHSPESVILITRQAVKAALCNGNVRANDAGVRAALIDKIGPPGTKGDPGPTYGVTSHAWAALAVAWATECGPNVELSGGPGTPGPSARTQG
jgi:hypothetical protein